MNKDLSKNRLRRLDPTAKTKLIKLLSIYRDVIADNLYKNTREFKLKTEKELRQPLKKVFKSLTGATDFLDLSNGEISNNKLQKDLNRCLGILKKYYAYVKFINLNPNQKSSAFLFSVKHNVEFITNTYANLIVYLIYKVFKENDIKVSQVDFISTTEFAERLLNLNIIRARDILRIYQEIQTKEKAKKLEENIRAVEIEKPESEFVETRCLSRHFIIHSGQTNTGKTYSAIEDLKNAPSGAYLGPLRLLSIEVYDKLKSSGVNCDLLTGEEEFIKEGSTHVSSTVEKANYDAFYDVCVIDECQMISDSSRGGSWTKAILGIKAKTIHLCTSPTTVSLLKRLIHLCGDTYEIEEHTRNTELIFENIEFNGLEDCKKGDALIAFGKKRVLRIAKELEGRGIRCSVIYGALPYETRKRQFENFLNGKTEVIVSTDAIGLGVNLPILRVVLVESQKYDGVRTRYLLPEEVKQIAGRAGRRGIYETGYVNALNDRAYIKKALESPYKAQYLAKLPISDLICKLPGDLKSNMIAWKAVAPSVGFEKCSIDRNLLILETIESCPFLNHERLSKENLFKLSNMFFSENSGIITNLFLNYVKECFFKSSDSLTKPNKDRFPNNLEGLETYYKALELYFNFSNVFSLNMDKDWIMDEKYMVSLEINHLLGYTISENVS